MVWKPYPYHSQWLGVRQVYIPLINAKVSNPHSGYSHDSEIANALRINLGLCREIEMTGVGGSKKAKVCEIDLEIPELSLSLKKTPVIFVDGSPFDIILGQNPFFETFDIRFEKRNNMFFIKKP